MSSQDIRKIVDAAVEAALSRLKAELVDSVIASIPAPEPPPPPPPPPVVVAAAAPAAGLDVPGLRRDLFSAMDGNSQVESLNALMASITSHWHRAVLFLAKGAVYQPWDARGFDGGIGNAAAKQATVAADQDTILAAAISGSGAQSANHLLDVLGPAAGLRAAVPLGIRGKAAAILYVDGPKGSDADAVAALEILSRVAAQSIELGMFNKRVPPFVRCEAVTASAAAAPAPAPAPAVAEPEEGGFAWGGAAPAAPAPVAAAPAPEPEMEVEVEMEAEPAAPAPSAWAAAPPAVEPPAPAPSFVAPPPVAAAPPPPAAPAPAPAAPAPAALSEGPAGTLDPRELLKGGAKPVVDAGQAMGAPKVSSRWKPVREQMKTSEAADPALAAIPEAERAKHVEARKIARLLVSEIELYNQAKVAVGRKNKDLYERLKEDIERSRQTYLQRVDPDVAAKSNYFQDELVATLAAGDAAVLGPTR